MNKKCLIFLLLLILTAGCLKSQNNVGIGTNTPDYHAILDLQSTEKGILIPRMSGLQRDSLGLNLSPAQKGLMVFDNDSIMFFFWNGFSWQTFETGPMGPQGPPSNSILYADFTNTSNGSGTNEQVLKSWIMQANTLTNNGTWIEIEVLIYFDLLFSGPGYYKLKVGGISVVNNSIHQNGSVHLHYKMYRISGTNQKILGLTNDGFSWTSPSYSGNVSLDLSTDIEIQVSGTNQISAPGSITVMMFTVRKIQ